MAEFHVDRLSVRAQIESNRLPSVEVAVPRQDLVVGEGLDLGPFHSKEPAVQPKRIVEALAEEERWPEADVSEAENEEVC